MFKHYKFENNVMDNDKIKGEITKAIINRKVYLSVTHRYFLKILGQLFLEAIPLPIQSKK